MTDSAQAAREAMRMRPIATFVAIGIAAVIVLMVIFAGWTGEDGSHAGVEAMILLALNLPWALAWLCCAFGLGWPLRLLLARDAQESSAIQLALGIAFMLVLIAALGRTGFLQLGGNLGAWALLLLGIGLSIEQIRRRTQSCPLSVVSSQKTDGTSPLSTDNCQLTTVNWLLLAAAPSVAVLLLAAMSAPGWLWRTEFGGYDAMSYHLQLPKQWLALGGIMPLEHNVYSFLPSYVEGAFYHLMVLQGDAMSAVYAAQLLHGSFALMAAWLVGRLVLRLATSHGTAAVAGAIAVVILIGTPWVIVTGSLAYNEMAVALLLAGGLLVLREPAIKPWQRGALIGLLAGAACGAKLTAVGFAAVPLVALLLMSAALRAWPKALLAGAVAGIIALSPYLIGNVVSTGNPVFPFATSAFGSGHWSDEQIAIWNEGHRATGTITERATEAWQQLLRYGIGPNPYEAEPWLPQWSILPWLALVSIIALCAARSLRPWGIRLLIVLLLQLAFWIGFTHIKSRFMLPMVVPGAVAVGLCISMCLARIARDKTPIGGGRVSGAAGLPIAAQVVIAASLVIWSCVPVSIFAREAGGAPAARISSVRILTGDGLSPADRETIGRELLPSVFINYLLPPHARVLFIGEAAPLYYHEGRYDYQTTWDRGPMSVMMREATGRPVQWLAALRERGYTHVLIHPVMLRVWEESGWNDPNLTIDRILGFAETHLELQHAWPTGERLYRIP